MKKPQKLLGQTRLARYNVRMKRILAAAWLVILPALPTAFAAQYDCIIRHGRIVDGTGNPAYFADVAIKEGRVVQIAFLEASKATVDFRFMLGKRLTHTGSGRKRVCIDT